MARVIKPNREDIREIWQGIETIKKDIKKIKSGLFKHCMVKNAHEEPFNMPDEVKFE